MTPRSAAVGLALEPESSRWRLQETFRLSVWRTCAPVSTCNPQGSANRLRDIANWRTHQGGEASIPKYVRLPSALLVIRMGGQGLVDAAEQVTHAISGFVGLLIEALLLVQ